MKQKSRSGGRPAIMGSFANLPSWQKSLLWKWRGDRHEKRKTGRPCLGDGQRNQATEKFILISLDADKNHSMAIKTSGSDLSSYPPDGIVLKACQDKQVVSKNRHNHWHNLNTLFDYPEDIRKLIYTTKVDCISTDKKSAPRLLSMSPP
jgi:hypothetical protein